MKGNIFISDFYSVSAKLRKLWFLIHSVRSLFSAAFLNRLARHVEWLVPLQLKHASDTMASPELERSPSSATSLARRDNCAPLDVPWRDLPFHARKKCERLRQKVHKILRYPKLTNEKGRDTFARILPHTLSNGIHFLWIRSNYQSTHFFTHKSSSRSRPRGWKINSRREKGRKIYINDDDMGHSNDGFEGNFLLLNIYKQQKNIKCRAIQLQQTHHCFIAHLGSKLQRQCSWLWLPCFVCTRRPRFYDAAFF